MPCYHPLTGYRHKNGRNPVTGKWPITFKASDGYVDMPVTMPCGQCIGCRLERSRQWAVRCVHEASLHQENCFLTLTYRDVPENGSLNKRDITLFFKRLRKRFGAGIRYLQCGEYGDLNKRPHHHVLLFGFDFSDKYLWSRKQGLNYYRSPILERLWPYGISVIGALTFESAAYVARYVTKKITGERAAAHYAGRLPEYITMSRRPGIAAAWFDNFADEVYLKDKCVVRPGLIARPPRYYDQKYDLLYPEKFARIKIVRERTASQSAHNTPDRLAVRECVQALRVRKLVRGYEQNLEV